MSSKSQGQVAYLSKKNTSLKYKKILRPDDIAAIASRPATHCAAGVFHRRSGGAESIMLSAGGAESMMLSARAESIILAAPPAESMILSA